MPEPVTAQDRDAIAAALAAGHSVSQVARQTGRAKSTVSRIARVAGVNLERSRTEKATQARCDYGQTARLALLNQGFDKAATLLQQIDAPLQLQQWAVAVGVLIDKRRLEDGDATARTEVRNDGIRERLAGRLDELAARRGAPGSAG